MKRLRGRRGVAAAVVVVAVAVGGIAYASIPGPDGVIHGCYRKTTGELIVVDSGKVCEEGWKSLNWSQTGPTGLTGPKGPTGATGPTGPTGALSSAYVDASSTANQMVAAGGPVVFPTVLIASGITLGVGTFTVATAGVYQVTFDLVFGTDITVQLSVNGSAVGPGVTCIVDEWTCTVTHLLSVSAGDVIRLFNAGGATVPVGGGSSITIVRIA
jgi:BclA C-terminal domain